MATQPQVKNEQSSSVGSARPDWNSINEEIRCPLCDYNLRGLVAPRCPECGYRYEWADLLDPLRRLHPYLFEHHPERTAWAFRKTLRGGLRPAQFWRAVSPVQPSYPRRLLGYWLRCAMILAVLLTATSVAGFIPLVSFNMRLLARNRASFLAYLNSPRGADHAKQITSRYGSVQAAVNETYAPWSAYKDALTFVGKSWIRQLPLLLNVLAWPWITILTLLLFQFSMRRARINRVHVARCVLYSQDVPSLIGFFAVILLQLSFIAQIVSFVNESYVVAATLVLLSGAGALFTYRLAKAYELYLRFDHPAWTVAASQALTFLILLNITLGLTVWR
jgi:hypothetical protein